jgi:hypothetical protein
MRSCILFTLLLATVITAADAMRSEASAQSAKKPRAQSVALQMDEKEVRRSVFSGNEVRIGMLYAVDAGCEGTPLADVRVVRQPAKGELSFREMSGVVELKKNSPRARCNGTPIKGVGVFYRSREDFTGTDRMQIEVDYKVGLLRRYTLIVDVR